MAGQFSAATPRLMQWGDVQVNRKQWTCPKCGQGLTQDQQTYVLALKHSGKTEAAMVRSSGGHFCADCPVVVLDRTVFGQAAVKAFPQIEDVSGFTVAGLVNQESEDGKPALVAFLKDLPRPTAPEAAPPEPIAEAEVEAAREKTEKTDSNAQEPSRELSAGPRQDWDFTPVKAPQIGSGGRPKNRKKLRKRRRY